MAATKLVPKLLEDMTPEEREAEHVRRLRELLETKKADIRKEQKQSESDDRDSED